MSKELNLDIHIPDHIRELSAIFKENGKNLYIIGGYVRDSLIGLKPKDIDLCTDSLPDETLGFLSGRYKVDLVGKSFGVVILKMEDDDIEIASFRVDGKGRKPTVELGVTIEEDVQRRDLTISAIYFDIEQNKIVDHVGGLKDMANCLIKMVGDPYERIDEDPLRILRVVRYTTRYNFEIDPTTEDAVKKSKLTGISRERIVAEIRKAFDESIRFCDYLALIHKLGLWSEVLPKMKINEKFIEIDGPLVLYFAHMLMNNDTTKFTKYLKTKYKYSLVFTDTLRFLIDMLKFDLERSTVTKFKKEMKRIKLEEELAEKWVDFLIEKSYIDQETYDILLNLIRYKLKINGNDVMNDGFSGRDLGKEIERREKDSFRNCL
jgi:tRNA nucleotidyltransferase/poly(A) polymerase